MESKKLSHYYTSFVKIFITATIAYWLVIRILWVSGLLPSRNYFNVFGILLSLMPLFGIILGIVIQKEWGGFHSYVGKSLIFISVSLTAWFVGQTIYFLLYAISGDVPYPGLPDYFFILIDPFYALALFYIMKYSGAHKSLGISSFSRFLLLVIPIASFYINMKIFFGDWGTFLGFGYDTLFDYIYTFGSIAVMSVVALTIVLSISKLGGKLKSAVYLFFIGMVFQYAGDVMYAFLEPSENFLINGSRADFLFFLSIAAITLGLIKFNNFALSEKKE